MTRAQAVKEGKRRWGAKALLRVGPDVTSPEKREAARQRQLALRGQHETLKAERARRLADLPWLAGMNAEIHRLYKEIDRAGNAALSGYRFDVGQQHGWVNEIKGSGDTWEEAFAAADDGK